MSAARVEGSRDGKELLVGEAKRSSVKEPDRLEVVRLEKVWNLTLRARAKATCGTVAQGMSTRPADVALHSILGALYCV